MNMPKILVGGPISSHHEYCTDRYIESLKNLDYPNYDILLIDNTDSDEFYNKIKDKINVIRAGQKFKSITQRMVYCRNMMRKKVLEENYDYYFDIDQDVIVPKDAIKKLIAHNKEVITGVYYNYTKEGEKMPILWAPFSEEEQGEIIKNKEKIRIENLGLYDSLIKANWNFKKLNKQIKTEEVEGEKLIEIRACGTGCLMIHRNILERIEFKENFEGGYDDVLFCSDVWEKLDKKIYCDTSVKCDHLTKERPWFWAKVNNKYFIAYGV